RHSAPRPSATAASPICSRVPPGSWAARGANAAYAVAATSTTSSAMLARSPGGAETAGADRAGARAAAVDVEGVVTAMESGGTTLAFRVVMRRNRRPALALALVALLTVAVAP